MTTYIVKHSTQVNYRSRVDAATPQEAINKFWQFHQEDCLNAMEVDSSGPINIHMTDIDGSPIAWWKT